MVYDHLKEEKAKLLEIIGGMDYDCSKLTDE
jgi:hypothetical protein